MAYYRMGIITDNKPTEPQLRRLMAPYEENPENTETVFSRRKMAEKIMTYNNKSQKKKLMTDDDFYLSKVAEYYDCVLSKSEDTSKYTGDFFTIDNDFSVHIKISENQKWNLWRLVSELEDIKGETYECLKVKDLSKKPCEIHSHPWEVPYSLKFPALPLYAIIYNGEWLEPGKPGMFGMIFSDTESKEDYLKKYEEIIHSPENQEKWITSVRCHI